MRKDRSSPKVRIGRKLQELSWLLSPLDSLITPFFRGKGKEDPYGLLVLLAPPRSGSTLTYQLMRSGIKGTYLSNLQNLLYANPLLGHLLQDRKCSEGISSFRSSRGFVPGFCGESEGLKFWRYWIDQGLEEQATLTPPQRAKSLEKAVRRIDNKVQGPFMTGFLGHVFAIDALRSLFPRIHFVHLKRDLLSNAASLHQFSPDSWRSTKPLGYEEYLERPREEQVVEQIIAIHRRILKKRKEAPEEFLEVAYEDLCQDPCGTLKKLGSTLQGNGCPITLKNLEKLPSSFEMKQVPTDDRRHQGLQKALEDRMKDLEEAEAPFFRSIFRPGASRDQETHDLN